MTEVVEGTDSAERQELGQRQPCSDGELEGPHHLSNQKTCSGLRGLSGVGLVVKRHLPSCSIPSKHTLDTVQRWRRERELMFD